jgi:hypothetical protein
MNKSKVTRKELLELLHYAIDGVDGFEAEQGYLRYWNERKINRARAVLEQEYYKS